MRQHLDRDEVSLHIDAGPKTLYDLISDITRTHEFSPNVRRSKWIGGATGPSVGARFKAINTAARGPAWPNKPVVTVASPGEEFTFRRTEPFAGTLEWRYRFVPEDGGTRVTESYEVIEPITLVGWFIIGTLCGQTDSRATLRHSMEETLRRVRAAVEQPANR